MSAPVLVLTSDLLFSTKIRECATHAGVAVKVTRDESIFAAELGGACGVIIDLAHRAAGDSVTHGVSSSLPLVCFYSHVNHAAEEDARARGASDVLPRSKFVVRLPEILTSMASTAPQA